jgi:hypothetical protein
MEPSLSTRLQAEGIALAIDTFAQQKPLVAYQPDGTADVYFTQEQIAPLQAKLAELIAKKGTVNIHAAPIVVPVLLKKLWPVILGIAGAGFLVAVLTMKRR